MPFDPGDPYDQTLVLKFQDTLSDTGYFQHVEVVAHPEDAVDLRVPIVATLSAAARQKWTLGGGWGTDTGARGRAALDLRRVNRLGHKAELDLSLSRIDKTLQASYIVPRGYPRTSMLRYSLGYADINSISNTRHTALAQTSIGTTRGLWRETYSLAFQRERYSVGSDDGTSNLVMPEVSWTRVIADDRLYPTHGRRLNALVQGAHDSVLSNATFVEAKAEGKYIRTLIGSVRLILRAQVGKIETTDFHSLPPSIRFFAGGVSSVRGYAFEELGPTDTDGHVIGGDTLLTTTIEVDSLFFEKFGRWGLAAFYDAGNAMNSFGGDLKRGVGAGIRWLSRSAWYASTPAGGSTIRAIRC